MVLSPNKSKHPQQWQPANFPLLKIIKGKKAIPCGKFIREGFLELYDCSVSRKAADKLCSCSINNVIVWSCLSPVSSGRKKCFKNPHWVLKVYLGLSGRLWNASRIHRGWLKGKFSALLETLTLFFPLGNCSRTCCIWECKAARSMESFLCDLGISQSQKCYPCDWGELHQLRTGYQISTWHLFKQYCAWQMSERGSWLHVW